MDLPRFMVSRDIKTRGIAKLGVINTTYRELSSKFGNPCLSESAGDDFDGFETVAWKIKFENGLIAEISDVSEFGVKNDYRDCKKWAIYGHNQNVLSYVKRYLGK
jgi:hypothetical protein